MVSMSRGVMCDSVFEATASAKSGGSQNSFVWRSVMRRCEGGSTIRFSVGAPRKSDFQIVIGSTHVYDTYMLDSMRHTQNHSHHQPISISSLAHQEFFEALDNGAQLTPPPLGLVARLRA